MYTGIGSPSRMTSSSLNTSHARLPKATSPRSEQTSTPSCKCANGTGARRTGRCAMTSMLLSVIDDFGMCTRVEWVRPECVQYRIGAGLDRGRPAPIF